MKKPLIAPVLLVCLSCCILACAPSSEEKRAAERSQQPDSTGFISSSAAVETGKDTSHTFVRTSGMKFRVKNVYRSTVAIEDIALRSRGFVTLSELRSTVESSATLPLSADSSLDIISYTVHSNLVIRVPNTSLDTVLKQIAAQIDFLDYRIIRADDVKLRMLSGTLSQQRMKKYGERLARAIDQRGKKLSETSTAEDNLLNRQEQADNARVNNMDLADQVSFSTVSIDMYQGASVRRELRENTDNTAAYGPGLLEKIRASIHTGWEILEALLLFIVKCWGFILIGALLWLVYRRYMKS